MIGASSAFAVVAERVRDARARRASLRIVGAGSWLDAGRPCVGAESLELSAHTGIVEYEPGDLTLTARAGTSLADIASATAANGQWLTLDPHGAAHGTLGATVATASAGPLSSAFGTPRDHVLGCEFITGAGDVVRAGGRVVKNVAGFDLVRLVTGAWGAFGAITEVTVRLRARPEVDRTIGVRVAGGSTVSAADAARAWLRSSEYTPLAAELVSPSLARALAFESGTNLLVRLGGNAAFVQAALGAVSALGESADLPASTWRALSEAEPSRAIVLRVSSRPAGIGALWGRAVTVCERAGGYAHATLARGVVRCVIPTSESADDWQSQHDALRELTDGVTAIGERIPAPLWTVLAHARSSDALALGVRHAFDPDRIMNDGILGA